MLSDLADDLTHHSEGISGPGSFMWGKDRAESKRQLQVCHSLNVQTWWHVDSATFWYIISGILFYFSSKS